jgi:protein gp37
MADKSKIEWTDASWNPIRARNKKTGKVGWHCEHATTGCQFCYAENFNVRLGTRLRFKPGHRDDIELFLDEQILTQPLRWKRARKIFVGSMTDIFADFVTDAWLDLMFAVMALSQRHTFQVLTKRAGLMQDYMRAPHRKRAIAERVMCISEALARRGGHEARIELDHFSACFAGSGPFRNVWLGVSAERQQEADERIPRLLQTPAAARFISAEPLLGAIVLHPLGCGTNALTSSTGPNLDWVIAGGESGPKARPMSIHWARELRDQCAAAGVPFFFKQWGEWAPAGVRPSGSPGRFAFGDYEQDRSTMIEVDGYPRQFTQFGARSVVERVGKKRAGRVLDGKAHSEFPTARG